MKPFLPILFLSVLMIACDPIYTEEFYAENRTSEVQTIGYKLQPYKIEQGKTTEELVTLQPNEKKILFSYSEIGLAADKKDSFLEHVDSIWVINKPDFEISNRKKWTFLNRKGKKPVAAYTLMIRKDDNIN